MKPLDRNRRLAALLITLILAFWATSSWAASIGYDSTIGLSRTVVLPEDGTGGIAISDAVQFNTGFTLTAFFGHVAFYIRCMLEVFK
jgi:hypothetical protein